jgi:hypothetical protein
MGAAQGRAELCAAGSESDPSEVDSLSLSLAARFVMARFFCAVAADCWPGETVTKRPVETRRPADNGETTSHVAAWFWPPVHQNANSLANARVDCVTLQMLISDFSLRVARFRNRAVRKRTDGAARLHGTGKKNPEDQ